MVLIGIFLNIRNFIRDKTKARQDSCANHCYHERLFDEICCMCGKIKKDKVFKRSKKHGKYYYVDEYEVYTE